MLRSKLFLLISCALFIGKSYSLTCPALDKNHPLTLNDVEWSYNPTKGAPLFQKHISGLYEQNGASVNITIQSDCSVDSPAEQRKCNEDPTDFVLTKINFSFKDSSGNSRSKIISAINASGNYTVSSGESFIEGSNKGCRYIGATNSTNGLTEELKFVIIP